MRRSIWRPNRVTRPKPDRPSATAVTTKASRRRRRRIERKTLFMMRRSFGGSSFGRQYITEAAARLDEARAQFLAHAPDQNLDRVRFAVAVFALKLFGEFVLRHDAAGIVHHVGDEPVFLRRKR